jgi:hypothetical protein|tara:strand:+ start:1921 stop:2292 length:372 start_codon:yes stop_codon:yes gene_type:complete
MKFFTYISILLSFNTLLANGPEMSPYAKTKSTVYSPVTVSVEELEINEVNIYSFDKVITVDVIQETINSGEIFIFDLAGKNVLHINSLNNNLNKIPVNFLNSGIYLVNVYINGNKYNQKVFIK